MLRNHVNTVVGSLVLCSTVFLCTSLARAEDERDPDKTLRETIMRSDTDYWLGVYCTRPSATLRTHLRLVKGEGLVVRRVLERSPAAEAGIKVHDVILRFGSTDVGKVAELIDAIDREQDRETVVTLIRESQKTTEMVTPAKRLEPEFSRPDLDADEILRWMEDMAKGEENPFRFRFFHPGTIIQDEKGRSAITLPRNLKIAITREEDSPAKVIVEKDGESWEVTTDDITTLPDSIFPFVERFLSGVVEKEKKKAESNGIDPALPEVRFEGDAEPVPNVNSDDRFSDGKSTLEKQLDNLESQLRHLRKNVQKLRDDS